MHAPLHHRKCPTPTQVRTVPGLDCIYRLRLDHSNVLGFRWGVGHDAAVAATAAAACACSLDGQLVLAGPSNEIARLTVVRVSWRSLHAWRWVRASLARPHACLWVRVVWLWWE